MSVGIDPRLEAIKALTKQGKDVIAIDPTFVLCYWKQDNSYVIWRWYLDVKNMTVHCECGEYMQADLTSVAQAVKAYHERGLK